MRRRSCVHRLVGLRLRHRQPDDAVPQGQAPRQRRGLLDGRRDDLDVDAVVEQVVEQFERVRRRPAVPEEGGLRLTVFEPRARLADRRVEGLADGRLGDVHTVLICHFYPFLRSVKRKNLSIVTL